MVPVVESVNVPFFAQFLDEDGRVQPNDVMDTSAGAMIDELARLDAALRPLVRAHERPHKQERVPGAPKSAACAAANLPWP